MIPQADQATVDLAQKLATDIATGMKTSFDATNAMMISMLLGALSRETASGIDTRLTDGTELKTLFAAADSSMDPSDVAPDAYDRQRFCASEPANLTLAEVGRWLDEGLELLIDLHAWAETHDPDLNLAIWDFLSRHADRHQIPG